MEELKLTDMFLNYHVQINCITGCSLQRKLDRSKTEPTTTINTSLFKKPKQTNKTQPTRQVSKGFLSNFFGQK